MKKLNKLNYILIFTISFIASSIVSYIIRFIVFFGQWITAILLPNTNFYNDYVEILVSLSIWIKILADTFIFILLIIFSKWLIKKYGKSVFYCLLSGALFSVLVSTFLTGDLSTINMI